MTTPATTLGTGPNADEAARPVSTAVAAASSSLGARFRAVREASETLVEGLAPEDFVVQSMDDVSPTKWHLAHTSWFWEAFLLREWLPGYEPFHPSYHYLFNSYYVQAGERHCRAQRGYLSRPTVAEVMEYRKHVDTAMDRLLGQYANVGKDGALSGLVELGLNHEQQHQELILTDLKHVFSVNPLRPAYREGTLPSEDPVGAPPTPAESLRWIPFEGGLVRIGSTGDGFHFDNEAPNHRRFLEPFVLADRLSTNREYLAFMNDGGYRRAELWMSEGWAKREIEGWTEPFYWERRGEEWWSFTLSGMRPLDLDEAVCHLNWYEADAFARWSGARLPREDEWEVAASMVAKQGNLVESRRYHPDRAPAQTGERPVPRQMYGDVWEWTSSPYSPYPGYVPLEGVVGEYNGKFMCGQFVLRGGSCATPETHIRHTYRNFFPPDAAWQFSGMRLAKDPG